MTASWQTFFPVLINKQYVNWRNSDNMKKNSYHHVLFSWNVQEVRLIKCKMPYKWHKHTITLDYLISEHERLFFIIKFLACAWLFDAVRLLNLEIFKTSNYKIGKKWKLPTLRNNQFCKNFASILQPFSQPCAFI